MAKEIEISQRCEMNDCKSMNGDQRQQIEYQGLLCLPTYPLSSFLDWASIGYGEETKVNSTGQYLNESPRTLFSLDLGIYYWFI